MLLLLLTLVGARHHSVLRTDCTALLAANDDCREAAKYLVKHHSYHPKAAFTRLAHEFACPYEIAEACSTELAVPGDLKCERALRRPVAMPEQRASERASCGAHANYLVQEIGLETLEAVKFVAREYQECAPIAQLENFCSESVRLHSIHACKTTIFNDASTNAPTLLLSLQHSASKALRPLLRCTGVSTEYKECGGHEHIMAIENVTLRNECLLQGGFNILGTILNVDVSPDDIVSRVEWLHRLSGFAPAKPRIIVLTRSPLELVFTWLEAMIHNESIGILSQFSSSPRKKWRALREGASMTSRLNKDLAHEYEGVVAQVALFEAAQFVTDGIGLLTYFTDPEKFDCVRISIEDLRDPTRRLRILSKVIAHALGGSLHLTARDALHAFSATETAYSSKPPALRTEEFEHREFWKTFSKSGLLCEVLAVDGFILTAAELGHGAQIYNDVADCSLLGSSLLDVEPVFRDALRHTPRTSCDALGFVGGLNESWAVPNSAKTCESLKTFFAANHEYCCAACYERGCAGLVFVLASPLEEAGMCHLAMNYRIETLNQLYSCYEGSLGDAQHAEDILTTSSFPSQGFPVAIVGTRAEKTLDKKAVMDLQAHLDSGGLKIVTMHTTSAHPRRWKLERLNDTNPEANPEAKTAFELHKTVYMSNAFSHGSDVAVRLAPYSYCAVDKPHKGYLSSWEMERQLVVGEQYMPSYFTVWLKDGQVHDVIVNAEDPRLYRMANGEFYASVARHSWDDVDGGTEQWLIRLEPSRREVRLNFESIQKHERNWAPFVDGDMIYFVYSFCPYILLGCDADCRVDGKMSTVYSSDAPRTLIEKTICGLDLRGTSNFEKVILDPQRGPELLGVVHRTVKLTGRKVDRLYMHSFVTLSPTFPFLIQRVSQLIRMPTLFYSILDMIQFASGIHVPVDSHETHMPDAAVAFDYGVADCVSMKATVKIYQIAALMDGVKHDELEAIMQGGQFKRSRRSRRRLTNSTAGHFGSHEYNNPRESWFRNITRKR